MQYFQVSENDRLRRRIYLHLVDATDGITPETGEAGGSAKVSLNGNTPTTSVNALVAVDTTNQPGTYYLELSPGEIQFHGIVSVRYKSANTAEFVTLGQIMAFDPYTQYGQFSGGAGADIDYKKIKKLVDESVAAIPKPVEPKEPDLSPIQTALVDLADKVQAIHIPKAEKTDLAPVLESLGTLKQTVESIEMPETDLKPVLNKIDHFTTLMEPYLDDANEETSALFERIKTFFDGDMEAIKSAVAELSKKFEDIPYVVLDPKIKQPEAKASVLDEYLKL